MNNNILKLILIPPIENIDKITLCLKQKEINKDEIIQELIKSNTKNGIFRKRNFGY